MAGDNERDAVKAAEQLLANRPRHGVEGNVQSDIEALLRTLHVGTIESHYQLGNEQADIYLPNRRTFIECKPYPTAADPNKPQSRKTPESPRQQVERYVLAEMRNELHQPALPGFSTSQRALRDPSPDGIAGVLEAPDAPWTGIVTDGSNWTVYRWPHSHRPVGYEDASETFSSEGDALATFLADTLGRDMVGKEWIPRRPGDLFSDLKNQLDELHQQLPRRAKAPTGTKRRLWLAMMEASGMVPTDAAGQERLFLAHSFLTVVVRLVSHTLAGPRRSEEWMAALSDGFASWVLDSQRGKRWTEQVWQLVDRYDWRRQQGDVLRDLYHRYVSAEDRKVFGEFYTPDWLAALMVEEVLDDAWIEKAVAAALRGDVSGVGVLDPACGSGTFLYHAAHRILAHPLVAELRPVARADVVAQLLCGIDIHPVAVEVSRVNIERALPAEPSDGASAFRVFLGDSLQMATAKPLFGHTEDAMVLTTPRGKEACIPMDLVRSPSFAEQMRRMVNAAAQGKPLPAGLAHGDDAALRACHDQLTAIVKDEGNSVWTWYAVNLAGPHLLAERKIDRIVANPPWVKLSDIQVEDRKRAFEDLGTALGLQAGGKQAPHLDIASFFVLRTRELYAADPDRDPGSWLVKKSALRSGQWAPFRRKHDALAQSVDLQDLNPFQGGDATRCCLLMEHRRIRGATSGALLAKRTSNRRPAPQETLATARGRFKLVKAPNPLPQSASAYDVADIRQGATVVPHVLALVQSEKKASTPGWTHVETMPGGKKPWADLPSQTGSVPTAWLRPMHTSLDLLPYMASREPPRAIIPADPDAGVLADPGRRCPFWRELDEIYDAHRGVGRGTPPTLIDQFDFRKKLSAQPLRPAPGRRMVLYPASGDLMRAARTRAGVAVVNAKLYWLTVSSEAEAGYLVAILNARCLRRAFAESKESGRDFHLHPWRKVPIPRYDAKIREHRRLAELCAVAERVVERRVQAELAGRPTLGQPGLSAAARLAVSESKAGQEIERIVARLLPDQAD